MPSFYIISVGTMRGQRAIGIVLVISLFVVGVANLYSFFSDIFNGHIVLKIDKRSDTFLVWPWWLRV